MADDTKRAVLSIANRGWGLRDGILPLPGRNDGYVRVLLLGATGAGKTTLLRQLIGSHPQRDRFPSTSTAKTTVADLELIMAVDGPYEAVVSFFPRAEIQTYTKECITAASLAAAQGKSRDDVVGKLLEHREQRFRLSYLLGKTQKEVSEWDEEDVEEDERDDFVGDALSEEEQRQLSSVREAYITRIHEIAAKCQAALSEHLLEALPDELTAEDRDAFESLFEEELWAFSDAQALLSDIVDDVERKFTLMEKGTFERRDAWPDRWTFSTSDRSEFIEAVNRFTSNYAARFGRLLTPLVQGIRVRGPFAPSWWSSDEPLRLVLLDGEGLGHVAEHSPTLSPAVTAKYERADAVILVDSCKQPMMATPVAALRSLATTGHGSKLAVMFTHFDGVSGDNLTAIADKKAHVHASLENGVASLEGALGSVVVKELSQNLESRVFYGGHLDSHEFAGKPRMSKFVKAQLGHLLDFIRTRSDGDFYPGAANPVYGVEGIGDLVQAAVAQFRLDWDARFGRVPHPTIRREHWTRVRALSNRLSAQRQEYYDTLMPIDDLTRELIERFGNIISTPCSWDSPGADDHSKQDAIDQIKRELFVSVRDYIENRIWPEELRRWSEANNYSGTGSHKKRTRLISDIYTTAAPGSKADPAPEAAAFIHDLAKLFERAVTSAGGRVGA